MDIQINPLCVCIIHINRWRHVNLEASLEHVSWYSNPNFRPPFKQSLTIAVTTGVKDARIQVVSVTVKVMELLARVINQANGMDNKFPYSVLSSNLACD
jgi:hypothetical protein